MKYQKIDKLNEPHQKGDLKIYTESGNIYIYLSTIDEEDENGWLLNLKTGTTGISMSADTPTYDDYDVKQKTIISFRKAKKC